MRHPIRNAVKRNIRKAVRGATKRPKAAILATLLAGTSGGVALSDLSLSDMLPDSLTNISSGEFVGGTNSDGNTEGADFARSIGPAQTNYPAQIGKITYEGLDEQGRVKPVYARLTTQNRADAKSWGRGNNPDSDKADPPGWGHNEKVTVDLPGGKQYRGYFWNRSHLIADSLGGRESVDSWITGTRMQNVGSNNGKGGMAYTETKARAYLDDPANAECPLYYAATPDYTGNEIIPRTVTVDMQSCDKTLDERVIVDNVMPGYAINYTTGEFTRER